MDVATDPRTPRSRSGRRTGVAPLGRRLRASAWVRGGAFSPRLDVASNRPNDGTWMYRLDRSEAWMPKRRGTNGPAIGEYAVTNES
jgi:hypothetical protein